MDLCPDLILRHTPFEPRWPGFAAEQKCHDTNRALMIAATDSMALVAISRPSLELYGLETVPRK